MAMYRAYRAYVCIALAFVLVMCAPSSAGAAQRSSLAHRSKKTKRKRIPPLPYCAAVTCTGISAELRCIEVGDKLRLTANASDPRGSELTFEWSASGGRIIGFGPEAVF